MSKPVTIGRASPDIWELVAWRLYDQLEFIRRHRGKAAAEQAARRALESVEGSASAPVEQSERERAMVG